MSENKSTFTTKHSPNLLYRAYTTPNGLSGLFPANSSAEANALSLGHTVFFILCCRRHLININFIKTIQSNNSFNYMSVCVRLCVCVCVCALHMGT